jgi:hydrogenase/urease accessory protein HupE
VKRRAAWRRLVAVLFAFAFALCASGRARAHDIDSTSLTLTELTPGRFLVHFRSSSKSLEREFVGAPAEFPTQCRFDGAYLDCGARGLAGTIRFPWLEGTLTRVMVEIDWRSGARMLRIVNGGAPSLTVYGVAATGLSALVPILVDYTRLGVEHILTGFDHLFFVIALTLLVRSRRSLLATVTAFTLAHSLTLAATALGLLDVPVPPVEATIALSIVLVCAECLRGAPSLTSRKPWLVAFAFGLLHGLGFASALLAIGLPAAHLPSALFAFNAGVEIGQLFVIGSVLAIHALAVRTKLKRPWMRAALVYPMGGTAAFWALERTLAVFSG